MESNTLLEPKKAEAVSLLALGQSKTAVANAVGVARSTVYAWIAEDGVFRAALRQEQQRLQDVRSARTARLVSDAADVVGTALAKASERLDRDTDMAPRDLVALADTASRVLARLAGLESQDLVGETGTTSNGQPDPVRRAAVDRLLDELAAAQEPQH